MSGRQSIRIRHGLNTYPRSRSQVASWAPHSPRFYCTRPTRMHRRSRTAQEFFFFFFFFFLGQLRGTHRNVCARESPRLAAACWAAGQPFVLSREAGSPDRHCLAVQYHTDPSRNKLQNDEPPCGPQGKRLVIGSESRSLADLLQVAPLTPPTPIPSDGGIGMAFVVWSPPFVQASRGA